MKASQKLRCLKGGGGGGGWRETTPISITRKKSAFSRNFELICGQTKKTHSQSTFNRVRTHLESPWKLQSVLESPWISVLTLSNTDSQVSKRSKHRKTYQDKTSHVVEEPKKTDSRLFFAVNGVLEKWEMCPWRSLNFLFKKGTNHVLINTTLLGSGGSPTREEDKREPDPLAPPSPTRPTPN